MRKVKAFIAVLIIVLVLVLFFWKDILDFYSKLTLRLPEIEKEITGFVKKEVEKQVSLPPPLRAEKEYPEAFLAKDGVIELTNIQREKYGFPLLKENAKLNEIARAKLEDMFKNQYFSHYSPIGEGVADLAKNFGYEFLAIGENLAMGNFQDDKTLVGSWMTSPGHRANILNSAYQEIGVAVGKGIFKGETTWLAVQHFGLPLSACPQPDLSLKEKINENQKQILELQRNLLTLEVEIRTMRPKRGTGYIQKIEQYNALVSQYNAFVEESKVLIDQYNSQVNLLNQCVGEFAR